MSDQQRPPAPSARPRPGDVPIGSTPESLGRIDFARGVPLDRDEEIDRAASEPGADVDAARSPGEIDRLFSARLSSLEAAKPVVVAPQVTALEACARMRAAGQSA